MVDFTLTDEQKDLRELARSSKQRISLKRATSNPPISEDVLASSSGQWKAVALPEPLPRAGPALGPADEHGITHRPGNP